MEARPDNLSVLQDLNGGCQIFATDSYAYGQLIPLSEMVQKGEDSSSPKKKEEAKSCDRRNAETAGINRDLNLSGLPTVCPTGRLDL